MSLCQITRRRLLTCEAASRASPRGAILAAVPLGVFAEGAHVPGALDTAENHRYASCARASSAVPGGTEQHIGQLFDGRRLPGVEGPQPRGAIRHSPVTERPTTSANYGAFTPLPDPLLRPVQCGHTPLRRSRRRGDGERCRGGGRHRAVSLV